MRKVLSLNQQMEDLYCVSIDGSKFSDTNEEEVDKMRDMLSHAMRYTLTEKQKNCLSMYYFDKMTMKEIAATLGVNQSTVSRHVRAARVKLERLRAYVD
ncbi:MAG: sigma-70 family RNA polymerase sigma factor [Clostridia bacterium]|nr:sigma-70 family RNA polymerase sigma factor [Clostridia bacterium]